MRFASINLGTKYWEKNMTSVGLKNNKLYWYRRMNKLLILCRSSLVALLLISIPLIALGEKQRRYASSFPPSDSMIIKKTSELSRCPKDIKTIVGKLQTSENIWTLYYEAISTKTNNIEVYDNVQLKKLDTDIWILECSSHINGRSYDTFYYPVD